MGLKTFVKISNVSNLSDARYCAGMFVNMIGFNLNPDSKHQVKSGDYKEITEWVSGIEFVGEMNGTSVEQIQEMLNNYAVNYIEIDDFDAIEEVHELGKAIIFKAEINSENDLETLKNSLSLLESKVFAIIFKTEDENLFSVINDFLMQYQGNLKLIKGFEIAAEDEKLADFAGIEMEAKEEERPGFQDYGAIMDVLEAIEEY